MKLLKRSLLALAVLFVFLSAGVYLFMRSSLAPLDGQVKLQKVSGPVTVIRDTYGIPHIQAKNKIDALRALGYVVASERLFQIEMSRRLTQGELSEIFGPVALPSDKLYRNLMLKPAVERMLQHEKEEGRFDQQLWTEMEAYLDGINQYIATRPLPYELKILGIQPRPLTPIDAYILVGHMAYTFGTALKAEPLMEKLAKTLPHAQFQDLRNDAISGSFKTAKNIFTPYFDLLTEGLFFPSFEGSNAWLLSPQRSQSGKSLFANDPHIGFSSPSVWMEAHIQTPEFELYGHYLPLVPFAVLGHNQSHAWGLTMSMVDDMDLYREVLDKEKKTVLFKGKAVPYKEWIETIKVKGEPDVTLHLIETPHGPLMDEVLKEKNLALKWAFHSLKNNPLRALREMAEAKDMKKFERAIQYATAPGINVLYADAKNIAWWIFGDMAVKKNPNTDMPLDGSTGEDEYVRLLSWDEKPHLVNPTSGVIVSANSRPPGLPEGLIRGEWQSDDRYRTIAEALDKKEKWSAEEFMFLQNKNYNSQNKHILDTLFTHLSLSDSESAQYKEQLDSLRQWNLESDVNSTAASLYHQWNNENVMLILKEFSEEDRSAYLNTVYAWNFYRRVILDPKTAWWSDKNYAETITQGFRLAAQKMSHQPTWGQVHTIEYVHPMGRKFPLNYIFNLGPYPMPGSYNDINNNKMRALGGDFKVVAGPSTRRVIDFAHPQKSWGINPIGISGHILSPFYKDQVPLFLEGKYRPQLLDEKDVLAAKTHELVFE